MSVALHSFFEYVKLKIKETQLKGSFFSFGFGCIFYEFFGQFWLRLQGCVYSINILNDTQLRLSPTMVISTHDQMTNCHLMQLKIVNMFGISQSPTGTIHWSTYCSQRRDKKIIIIPKISTLKLLL